MPIRLRNPSVWQAAEQRLLASTKILHHRADDGRGSPCGSDSLALHQANVARQRLGHKFLSDSGLQSAIKTALGDDRRQPLQPNGRCHVRIRVSWAAKSDETLAIDRGPRVLETTFDRVGARRARPRQDGHIFRREPEFRALFGRPVCRAIWRR